MKFFGESYQTFYIEKQFSETKQKVIIFNNNNNKTKKKTTQFENDHVQFVINDKFATIDFKYFSKFSL